MKYKKIQKHVLKDHDHTLWCDFPCFMHGPQLSVRRGLRCADDWSVKHCQPWKGYYSSIAKCINIWRDSPRKVYETWCDLIDCETARDHAMRLPAQCISGRWGSVGESEDNITSGSKRRLGTVVAHMLDPSNAKPEPGPKRKKRRTAAITDVMDPNADESNHYRVKMGKWKMDTYAAVTSHVWWHMVAIMGQSHKPMQHHLSYLLSSQHKYKLAGLVFGKANQIYAEFSAQLASPTWARDVAHDPDLSEAENQILVGRHGR